MHKLNIRTVFFDLDDTLYDYALPNKKAMDEIYRFFLLEHKIERVVCETAFIQARSLIKEQLGPTASSHSRLLYFQKTFEILHIPFSSEALVSLEDLFWDTFIDNSIVAEGVIPFLKYLQLLNINIGIITDLTLQIQLKKIQALGLDKYISSITASEEAGQDKPDSKIYEIALHKEGVLGMHSAMIGDNYEKDMIGAKNMGFTTFWRHGSEQKKFADYSFQKYSELHQWF